MVDDVENIIPCEKNNNNCTPVKSAFPGDRATGPGAVPFQHGYRGGWNSSRWIAGDFGGLRSRLQGRGMKKNCGKDLGKSGKNHGKITGKSWENPDLNGGFMVILEEYQCFNVWKGVKVWCNSCSPMIEYGGSAV